MIITKRKLNNILECLENDSCDQSKVNGVNDFYWRCGNANAVNYIRHKLGIKRKSKRKDDNE